MIQQEINLNLIPSSEPVVVHCNQYDEGKSRIIAHLYNGSHPYTPGANATVKVQGTKPDNHAFQYWCDISGSTVTVDVNVQMTAVAGRTPTQLIVNETSGVTGSFAFYLDVQASTLPPTIDVSETDIPILTEEAQEAAQRSVQAAGIAEDAADRAASWSSNPPYIGANDNWFVYDINTEQFVDSGILARGTDGEDGERGSLWYRGTAVSGKSADPTVFPTGIADALPGDMYLNVTEGAVYHCVTGGSASVATWAYDFTLTGGGSGGVTNYNDLTNKPQINGVELSGNKSTSDLGINSGNVMLSSIMHIGGQTQTTTQEALEALDNKDSGGSFIKVTTPDASLYGDTLTLSDGTTTLTTVFDSSGNAEFNGVMMTGTLTLTTGSITRQIEVPYFGNYSQVISLWSATIAITTDSVDLYGETVTVKDSLNQTVGTATISAQGTASVMVSATGTYTVYCSTLTPEAVVVSAQTTYFVTFHLWTATLSISTTSTALYGKTVSIKKGGTTVGTTAFSSGGSASYRVHEIGIYTAECTYSGDTYYSDAVSVSAETTYPMSIDIITVETYEITATIYGSVGDTITYTDDNGQQTVTTDSTGKAENVSITITQTTAGVDPSITFTSSIAKDPTDLTADYSKAVTITENMTEIYVMPDATVYWYGNNDNCPIGGGLMQGYIGAGSNWVFNQNSISISSKGSSLLVNKEAIPTQDYSIAKIHCSASVSGGMVYTFCTTQDYGVTTNVVANMGDRYDIATSGSGIHSLSITQSSQGKEGIVVMNNSNSTITISCTCYAVWFE